MFERFTDRARKVMALANQAAQRLNHEYIAPEHILLGLFKEGCGAGATALRKLGVDMDFTNLRREIERIACAGAEMVETCKLPHTPGAKKVIEYAVEEARSLNHNYVGTEHLLLGLLRENKESIAYLVLMNRGVTYEKARNEILNLLGPGNEKDNKPGFQGFSDRARQIFKLANAEALRFNHEYIDTRHILTGFIKEGSGVGMTVLKTLNVDIKELRLDVERTLTEGPAMNTAGKLPLDASAKKVIEYAIEGARSLGRNYVGSEHILLGLLYENRESISAKILQKHGVTYEQVRDGIVKLLDGGDGLPDESEVKSILRFTDRARKVIALADQARQKFHHGYRGAEHILLGLIKEGSGVCSVVFQHLNVEANQVRVEIEELMKNTSYTANEGEQIFTQRIKKIINGAIEEAKKLHSNYVGTEHLLLSVLRDGEGTAAKTLKKHKVTYEQARDEIVNVTG